MKRASFLKIVSVVMVVAMMLSTTIGVYADSIADGFTASQNPADTTINIKGSLEGATPYEDSVIVVIFHKDVSESEQADLVIALKNGTFNLSPEELAQKIVGIAQATVDANGKYECDITLDDTAANGTGNYSIYVAPPSATPTSAPVYFVPSDGKLVILKDIIQETNASDLQNIIATNKLVFAFHTNTMWDSISAHQIAAARALVSDDADYGNKIFARLRADIANVTRENMEGVIKDVTLAIAQEIYAQAIANDVPLPIPTVSPTPSPIVSSVPYMNQYADVAAYDNAYTNYCSATGKTNVDTNIDNATISSFAQLLKEYKEQILLNAVTNPKNDNGANSRLALDALASMTGLDADSSSKYNLSEATNRQTVADACKASGATTFADLNTAFINAVDLLPDPSPTATPTPGPGTPPGGGGGGGSIVVVQPTPTPSQKPIYERYNDINDYEWAWDAIEVLSDRSVVAGYGNGSFAPTNSILREEFIKLAVVGLLGADAIDASAVSSFTDAQSGWYAPYIAAAESNNITSGIGNGFFGTGAQITRQDMALMLYRILRSANVYGPADEYAFTDAAEIADYAAEAVYTLKNMGIINGDPDGSFRPNGQTTRAEAAVLLYKTLNKLGKIIY